MLQSADGRGPAPGARAEAAEAAATPPEDGGWGARGEGEEGRGGGCPPLGATQTQHGPQQINK